MARYLVTGGWGFVGSHLTHALLAQGDEVVILDESGATAGGPPHRGEPRVEVVAGSPADGGLVGELVQGVDGCFHLAGDLAGVRRQRGTATLFEAIRRHCPAPVPVVYTSSAAVYGAGADSPLDEGAAPGPLSLEAIDHLAGEHLAARAGVVHGVPTTGFRLFEVYGFRRDPRFPLPGVVGRFARCLAERRPLPVPGDGNQVRDFVFVGDVVAYLAAAMRRPAARPEVFNLCTGVATSILALAATMGRLMGEEPAYRFVAADPDEPDALVGSPVKLAGRFGFPPRVGLQRGLEMTLDALHLAEWF